MTRPDKDYKSVLLKKLKDPKLAEAYINAALEHGTQEELLVALKNVCEAHGMARTARKAKINRENMYRVLSAKGNPYLSTFTSILESTGLKLRVQVG
jgi:probable addiction module antidote protein